MCNSCVHQTHAFPVTSSYSRMQHVKSTLGKLHVHVHLSMMVTTWRNMNVGLLGGKASENSIPHTPTCPSLCSISSLVIRSFQHTPSILLVRTFLWLGKMLYLVHIIMQFSSQCSHISAVTPPMQKCKCLLPSSSLLFSQGRFACKVTTWRLLTWSASTAGMPSMQCWQDGTT